MPELSLYNIDQISNDVRREEITFSHLLDELIDHICCDVEYEMQKGMSFTDAYRKVRMKIGSGRRLKEIQEESLYAVDTKYRKMKNTMKISGIAGTVLLAFASLFKVMHWPAAGIMMTLAVLALAFIFMPSALGVLWKETHSSRRLFLFISAFFAAMFFLVGILFKVQHWPGAGLVLTLAGVSAVLFFIPSLLYSSLKNPENKSWRLVYILGAAGTICYIAGYIFKMQHWPLAGILMMLGLFILFVIVFPWYARVSWENENFIRAEFIFLVVGSLAIIIPAALVATNVQRSFDTGYFSNLGQQKAIYSYLFENNTAIIERNRDSADFQTMLQLHAKTSSLIQFVSSVESKMVAVTEGKQKMPAGNPVQVIQTKNGAVIDYEKLSNPFNLYAVQNFLAPGTESRSGIETAIVEYRNYLKGIMPAGELANLERMPDPSTLLPVIVNEKRKMSMISGLHTLALMKNSVLTIENSVLKHIENTK